MIQDHAHVPLNARPTDPSIYRRAELLIGQTEGCAVVLVEGQLAGSNLFIFILLISIDI